MQKLLCWIWRDKMNSNTGRTGLTVLDLLLVAFIVLKLCGVIDWEWGVVLFPLWIQLGIIAIVLIIALIVAIIHRD